MQYSQWIVHPYQTIWSDGEGKIWRPSLCHRFLMLDLKTRWPISCPLLLLLTNLKIIADDEERRKLPKLPASSSSQALNLSIPQNAPNSFDNPLVKVLMERIGDSREKCIEFLTLAEWDLERAIKMWADQWSPRWMSPQTAETKKCSTSRTFSW